MFLIFVIFSPEKEDRDRAMLFLEMKTIIAKTTTKLFWKNEIKSVLNPCIHGRTCFLANWINYQKFWNIFQSQALNQTWCQMNQEKALVFFKKKYFNNKGDILIRITRNGILVEIDQICILHIVMHNCKR